MSNGRIRLLCGTVLAFLAAIGHAAAEDRFIDTRTLVRHRGDELPPIPAWADFLTAPPFFQMRTDRVAPYQPAAEAVASRPSPLSAMAATSGLAGLTSFGAKAGARVGDTALGAAARSDTTDDYNDARGEKVRYGYLRNTEYLLGRKGVDPKAGSVTVAAVRDNWDRIILPNYGLDVQQLEQGGMTLGATARPASGWFDRAEVNAGWSVLHVNADNFTLRAPGSARLLYLIDSQTVKGAATLVRERGDNRTELGADARRSFTNSKRESWEYGMGALSSYRIPAVETVRAGLSAAHRLRLDQRTTLEGGLRYEMVRSQADDVDRSPAIASTATYNSSPRQLYAQTYGAAGGAVVENDVSGRLRAERRVTDSGIGWLDLSHMVRTAETGERWYAQAGPSTLMQIGNPDLEPEKHNRAELGARTDGGGFTRYGWGAPAGSWRLTGSAAADSVEDFISVDRARSQPGVLVTSSRGIVYRNVDAVLATASAELQAMPREWLGLRLVAMGARGRNVADHRPLYQVDPFEADLFVDLFGGEADRVWNLGLRSRLVAGKRSVDDSVVTGAGMDYGGPAGGFATFDLYGGLGLGQRLAVTAGIENLFDKLYREHVSGVPQSPTTTVVNAPGRTAFIRAVVAF